MCGGTREHARSTRARMASSTHLCYHTRRESDATSVSGPADGGRRPRFLPPFDARRGQDCPQGPTQSQRRPRGRRRARRFARAGDCRPGQGQGQQPGDEGAGGSPWRACQPDPDRLRREEPRQGCRGGRANDRGTDPPTRRQDVTSGAPPASRSAAHKRSELRA